MERLGFVYQLANARQVIQILLGETPLLALVVQRLRRQPQEFLVVAVGLPHGELGMVVDVRGDIRDLGLPKLDGPSDLLNQLVRQLHDA